MAMNSNNDLYYCPTNIPSHQTYYQQALTQESRPEEHVSPTSLLRDTLVHGKKTVTQNYAYSYTNINGMTSSYQITPNSQMISHNSYQTCSVKYPSSEISVMECEEFFNNLQLEGQQQKYNKYDQNYQGHNYVQSHNYTLCTPGPSTISMQYEQDKSKQEVIFNVQQELQIDSYNSNNNNNNNNNNIRQRNKNIRMSKYNRQREPYSNNVANYPWMFKRTNG